MTREFRVIVGFAFAIAIIATGILLLRWNQNEDQLSAQAAKWTPEKMVRAYKQEELNMDQLHEHLQITSDVFKRAELPYVISRFEAGPVEIVAIASQKGEYWQYLVFGGKNKATYAGHIDFRNNQNGVQPAVRVVEDSRKNDKKWIIMKALSGMGGGFSREEEAWYELSNNNLREVLRYPTEERRTTIDIEKVGNTPPFFTHITSRVRNAEAVDGAFFVDVAFSVQYTNGLAKLPEVKDIFRIEATIRYLYDDHTSQFVINTSESDRNNFHFAVWPDEMLRQQYAELEQIATSSDMKLKEWLKLMLDHLITSPEKQALLDLMEAEVPSA